VVGVKAEQNYIHADL